MGLDRDQIEHAMAAGATQAAGLRIMAGSDLKSMHPGKAAMDGVLAATLVAHRLTASAKALESAKGIIRSEVGKQTGIRLTPTLAFHLDAVPETAAHLEQALAEAARRDAEVQALAKAASYAAEADPYRRAEEDDETDEAQA